MGKTDDVCLQLNNMYMHIHNNNVHAYPYRERHERKTPSNIFALALFKCNSHLSSGIFDAALELKTENGACKVAIF